MAMCMKSQNIKLYTHDITSTIRVLFARQGKADQGCQQN